jgi:hypothetical protein
MWYTMPKGKVVVMVSIVPRRHTLRQLQAPRPNVLPAPQKEH